MPPKPPLSRAEWAKRKDRGKSYAGYLRELRSRRTVAPPPYPGYVSEEEIQQRARQTAEDAFAPFEDEIQRQQAEAARRAQERASLMQAASAAAAREMGNIGPQVQQGYDLAGQRTAEWAKGFSEAYNQEMAKSGADANALMAKHNVPEGAMIQPSTAGGDVLYGTGGFIPATTLAREGAAFGAAASQLPATELGRGQQNLLLQQREAEEEQRKYDQQLLDLKQRYPEAYRQALETLQSRQTDLARDWRSYGLQERASDVNEWYLANALRQSGAQITGIDPKTGLPTLARTQAEAEAAAAAKPHPDPTWSRLMGVVSDQFGNPIPGPDGRPQPVDKTTGKPKADPRVKAKQNRANALADARKTVFDLAQDHVGEPMRNRNPGYRVPENYLKPDGTGTNNPKEAAREGRASWKQVFNLAYSAIADDLKARYNIPDRDIRTLIRKRLIAAGFRPPKKRRPPRNAPPPGYQPSPPRGGR